MTSTQTYDTMLPNARDMHKQETAKTRQKGGGWETTCIKHDKSSNFIIQLVTTTL